MDRGHASELRVQVWESCPGFLGHILAHLPAFFKLGLCQGLMHQTEIRID